MISGAKSPDLFLVISLVRFLVHCWSGGGVGGGLVRGVPFLSSSQWSASMFHSWFEWQIWPSDKLKSHFWFRGQLKIYANAVTQKVMTDPLQSRLIETYIYLLRFLSQFRVACVSTDIYYFLSRGHPSAKQAKEHGVLETIVPPGRTLSVEENHAGQELSKTRSEPNKTFLKILWKATQVVKTFNLTPVQKQIILISHCFEIP